MFINILSIDQTM